MIYTHFDRPDFVWWLLIFVSVGSYVCNCFQPWKICTHQSIKDDTLRYFFHISMYIPHLSNTSTYGGFVYFYVLQKISRSEFLVISIKLSKKVVQLEMSRVSSQLVWGGSTIRTLLHGKINPKNWQVLSLGDVGFLLFFRVVSGDYGKACHWGALSKTSWFS